MRGVRALPAGTLAIAKARSGNRKIGEAATTYAAQTSCPTDCVFFDGGGCYAENGQLGKFVTEPLNAAARASVHDELDVALDEAEAIASLEIILGRPLRLHTVGDCASETAARIVAGAAARYMAAGGGPVWTYTHAWRVVPREAWGRVSVLASCETAADVQLARARGYATAVVVEEFGTSRRYEDERTQLDLLPCPAQTRDVPCSSCRLCFNDRRLRQAGYSIGFAIHGTAVGRRHAAKALRDPADPDRKRTSRELIPVLLEREPNLSNAEIARRLELAPRSVSEMRETLAGRPRRRAKAAA